MAQEEEDEDTNPLVMWKRPIAWQYWIDKTDATGQVIMTTNLLGKLVPEKVMSNHRSVATAAPSTRTIAAVKT